MYTVYRKISNGYYRRLFVTSDFEYAVTFALNSENCIFEKR